MNRIIIIFIAVFILIVPAIQIAAEPSISEKTNYYSISGTTDREIINNLNMNAPFNENGQKYYAHTGWFVNWNLWWDESNDSCAISRVETNVDIEFTLPKLEDNNSIPESLTQKWKIFKKALLHHENGHKSLGVKAANEIEKNIVEMAERRTCRELESDANRLANEIIKKYNELEIEYDQKTNHGMNEGAVFL